MASELFGQLRAVCILRVSDGLAAEAVDGAVRGKVGADERVSKNRVHRTIAHSFGAEVTMLVDADKDRLLHNCGAGLEALIIRVLNVIHCEETAFYGNAGQDQREIQCHRGGLQGDEEEGALGGIGLVLFVICVTLTLDVSKREPDANLTILDRGSQ